eukprot:5269356-Pyramimonas_sp.AAC.2
MFLTTQDLPGGVGLDRRFDRAVVAGTHPQPVADALEAGGVVDVTGALPRERPHLQLRRLCGAL